MLAEAIICQSCRRQPGLYQCAYCMQVICSACASDDPDRVVCRSPCQDTVARPAKRLKDHHDAPHSASKVAAPEDVREPVGVEEHVDKGAAASVPQVGAVAGDSVEAVPALQVQVTELDGESLPSDVIGIPMPPRSGG